MLNILDGRDSNLGGISLATLGFCLVQDIFLAVIHFFVMTVDTVNYVVNVGLLPVFRLTDYDVRSFGLLGCEDYEGSFQEKA